MSAFLLNFSLQKIVAKNGFNVEHRKEKNMKMHKQYYVVSQVRTPQQASESEKLSSRQLV